MARKLEIKLWHKGLLLIAAFLICEFMVFARFHQMVEQANAEARLVQHNQDILHALEELLQAWVDTGTSFATYVGLGLPSSKKRFEKASAAIPGLFADLESLTKDDAADQEKYAALKSSLIRAQQELKSAEEMIENNGEYNDKYFKKHLMPVMADMIKQLRALLDENKEATAKKQWENAANFRDEATKWLIVGVLVNVISVIVMAIAFWREVIQGLRLLADNSTRLARGLELRPASKGTDEIAHLDRIFHDMANTITDAAKKERAILDHTRSIIAHMPVGLLTIDEAGRICSANTRAAEMFGYQGEELIGKDLYFLFMPTTAADCQALIADLKQKSLNRVGEYKARRSGGQPFPVEVSLNEFDADTDERYLVNILDVSERYEIERMKREFVAMVSHDLRTPLTSVEASLTLLSAGALGNLSKDALETVTIAEQQVTRLRNLVNDLLDIAKIEAGKMDMKITSVPLSDVIDDSIAAVEPLADERDIKIETHDTDAIAIADGDRLVQVLVNFLSNAVKYSPEHGVINVDVERTHDWHEVRVTDQGPGIPAAHLESVFHRFEQVKGENQKSGTGLGLAISKTIIDQLGGSIGVTSEEGKGSTFWFRVPSAESKDASSKLDLPIALAKLDHPA